MDKAFLVGINRYPGAPLQGCVNDVLHMKQFVTTNYHLIEPNIQLCLDQSATTTGILTGLNWLISGSQPGDRLLFHYSGHGAQVPDYSGKEADNLDEVICPVDFDWSPGRMITDKQFYQLFSSIPAGVKFYWVSDSCHSGDLTRDLVNPYTFVKGDLRSKPKMIKQVSKAYPIPPHLLQEHRELKAKNIVSKTRALIGQELDVGFISGCRSNQTSADAYINGQPCGAATTFILKHLQVMLSRSICEVVAAVDQDLIRSGYSQQPQCEGARKNQPFMS